MIPAPCDCPRCASAPALATQAVPMLPSHFIGWRELRRQAARAAVVERYGDAAISTVFAAVGLVALAFLN